MRPQPHLHRPAGLEPPRLRDQTRDRRHRPHPRTRGMGGLRGRAPPPRLRRAVRPSPGALPPPGTPQGTAESQRPHLPVQRHGQMRLRAPAARDVRPRAQEATPTCAATTAAPTARSPPSRSTDTANGSTSARTTCSRSSSSSSPSASSARCACRSSPANSAPTPGDAKQNGKPPPRRPTPAIADLDRRIGLQLDALEKGIDPELIGARIANYAPRRNRLEARLRELPPTRPGHRHDRTARQRSHASPTSPKPSTTHHRP